MIKPSILTFITTYMCTSQCNDCCFDCSPKKQKKMTIEEIKINIQKSIESFPSITTVVFTGGECTLLGNDLFLAIKYCTELGLTSRIVTNGHWAKSKSQIAHYVKSFEDAGLKEINFSTGTEHQKFVPVENIINAVNLCSEIDSISSIVVNVESHKNLSFSINDFKSAIYSKGNDEILKNKLIVLSSPWMSFKERSELISSSNKKNTISTLSKGCKNIFNGIYINPNNQMLSCCGLACEYIPFLKIGSINKHDIKYLYNKQYNDFLKIWLFTEGPRKIIEHIDENFASDDNIHDCDYCLRLLTTRPYLEKLLQIDSNKIKQTMVNYNIKIAF